MSDPVSPVQGREGENRISDHERRISHLETLEPMMVPSDVGLVFGSMFVPGVDIVVAIGGVNPVEVENAAADGWAVGELFDVTFPTGGDEHYLTITVPGRYECIWNMSFHTSIGGAQGVHAGLMIDGIAIRDNGEAHRDVANANDDGNMGAPCIADLPNGTEEVSLWIANDGAADVHVVHSTLTIKLIGTT